MANKANMPPNFTQKWLICLGILLVLTLEKHCFRIGRRCKSNKRGSLNHKLVVEMTFSLSFSVFFSHFCSILRACLPFLSFFLAFFSNRRPTIHHSIPELAHRSAHNFPELSQIPFRENFASGNFRLGKFLPREAPASGNFRDPNPRPSRP